jgi:hypothetical protein
MYEQVDSSYKGTRQIRVILYAKEPSFHTSRCDVTRESARPGSVYGKAAGNHRRPRALLSLELPAADAGVRRLPPGVGNPAGFSASGTRWQMQSASPCSDTRQPGCVG